MELELDKRGFTICGRRCPVFVVRLLRAIVLYTSNYCLSTNRSRPSFTYPHHPAKTTYIGSCGRLRSWIEHIRQSIPGETSVIEESTMCRAQPGFAYQTARLERLFVVTEVIDNEFWGESQPLHDRTRSKWL